MQSSEETDLAIIIVNWNTKELLKKCLESIRENKGRYGIKTIVVDNASKDGSVEMVRRNFGEVILINSGGNIGFGKANNLAIPEVNAPLVLFLNPDTMVMPGALEGMVDFMEYQEKVGAMGCKMIYGGSGGETRGTDKGAHTLPIQWHLSPLTELVDILLLSDETIKRFKKYIPYKDPNKSGYVLKLAGACLMVRRQVLEDVGWFDERFFMYCEDSDLCRRIWEAGWKIYYMSDIKNTHMVGGASRKTTNNFRSLIKCESKLKYIEKYNGKISGFIYRVVVFFGCYFRLFLLLLMKTFSQIILKEKNIKYKEPFSKYMAMLKWSLKIDRAIIE